MFYPALLPGPGQTLNLVQPAKISRWKRSQATNFISHSSRKWIVGLWGILSTKIPRPSAFFLDWFRVVRPKIRPPGNSAARNTLYLAIGQTLLRTDLLVVILWCRYVAFPSSINILIAIGSPNILLFITKLWGGGGCLFKILRARWLIKRTKHLFRAPALQTDQVCSKSLWQVLLLF